LPAYTAVGAAEARGGSPPDSPGFGASKHEEAQQEVAIASTPGGSRLIDVARAASLKAERMIIEDTLHHVHWNRRRAAEQLGVSYKTLLNKIKDCGISRKA